MERIRIEDNRVWQAFIAVGRMGNFSKAAISLGIPLPQVSKRISKLESELGLRLFHRSTRTVRLTDEGKSLLPKVESFFSDMIEVENSVEKKGELSGQLKVTAVPFVAHRLLLPLLGEFFEKYPQLTLELDLSERFRSLVDEGYDLALRIDTPKDSNLVYRKLFENRLVFCASPAYLKAHSKIKKVEDLKNHNCLFLDIHSRCRFKNSSKLLSDYLSPTKITCESGAFLTDMAIAGLGVLLRAELDVREHLMTGKLVRVLDAYPLEAFGHVYAVIPTRRYLAPRVRAFLDVVAEAASKI